MAVAAIVIIAVVATFLVLKRRNKPASTPAVKPAKLVYQPKTSRRNRK